MFLSLHLYRTYCCTLYRYSNIIYLSTAVPHSPAIGCFTFLLCMFKLDEIWSNSATSRRVPAYSNNSGDCAVLYSLHPQTHSYRRYCSTVVVWYAECSTVHTHTIPSHDAIYLYGNHSVITAPWDNLHHPAPNE